MSIPLNGISELMNGQGLSDAMNFNFAPTAIVTIIILGIILIFVLPQIIYWATGINTSAFSWGRKGKLTQHCFSTPGFGLLKIIPFM